MEHLDLRHPAFLAMQAANHHHADERGERAHPPEPRRRLAVLTCMDCRIDPAAAYGLAEGEAHVLRNAGGRATPDVLRSLALSTRVLGTRAVAVVHHTRCGLSGGEDATRSALRQTGLETGAPLYAFDDLSASVWEDLEALAASPMLLGGTYLAGFVHEVDTGRLTAVGQRRVGDGATRREEAS